MNKLLSLLIFTYLFNSCSNKKEYIINDLSNTISDTLVFDTDEKNINGIEILIEGYIQGTAVIEFENGANRFNQIKLENKVNYIYKTEWYTSKMFFRYSPKGKVNGGNLHMKYKGY